MKISREFHIFGLTASSCKFIYFLNVFRRRRALTLRIDQRSTSFGILKIRNPEARPQEVANFKNPYPLSKTLLSRKPKTTRTKRVSKVLATAST